MTGPGSRHVQASASGARSSASQQVSASISASKVAPSMDVLPTFVRDSIAALSSKTRIVRADAKRSIAGKFPRPSSIRAEEC